VRLDDPMALRPACHQRGAFGRALTPQLGIQGLLAGCAWRRLARHAFTAGLSGCALSHGQTQPPTPLDFKVGGLDVVQPADTQ
jgi:hypothetical protein